MESGIVELFSVQPGTCAPLFLPPTVRPQEDSEFRSPDYGATMRVQAMASVVTFLSTLGAVFLLLSFVLLRDALTKRRGSEIHVTMGSFGFGMSILVLFVLDFDLQLEKAASGVLPNLSRTCGTGVWGGPGGQALFAAYSVVAAIFWTLALATYGLLLVMDARGRGWLGKVAKLVFAVGWVFPLLVPLWLIRAHCFGGGRHQSDSSRAEANIDLFTVLVPSHFYAALASLVILFICTVCVCYLLTKSCLNSAIKGMVSCAYEEHTYMYEEYDTYPVLLHKNELEERDCCPALLHKNELEERDCSNQFKDELAKQRWTIEKPRHKVSQPKQHIALRNEINAINARCLELARENEELKESVGVHCAEAQIFRDDFEAERRDREAAHDRMEAEKSGMLKQIWTLKTTIEQKNRELQQKDQQLTALRGERGTNTRQLSQRVADLWKDLEMARSQVQEYKTKLDLLKKNLEEEKLKSLEETHQRVKSQGECKVLQDQVGLLRAELESLRNNQQHVQYDFIQLNRLQVENLQWREKVNMLQQQLTVLQEYHDRNEAKKANARQALRQQQQQHFSNPNFVQGTSQAVPLSSVCRDSHVPPNMAFASSHAGQPLPLKRSPPSQQSAVNIDHYKETGRSPVSPYDHTEATTASSNSPRHHRGDDALGVMSAYLPANDQQTWQEQRRKHNLPNRVQYPASESSAGLPTTTPRYAAGQQNISPCMQISPPHDLASQGHRNNQQLPLLSNNQSAQTHGNKASIHKQQPRKLILPPSSGNIPTVDYQTLQDNPLVANIDEDIEEVANEVRKMTASPSTAEHSLEHDQHPPHCLQMKGEARFEIPIDPNLVCSKCGRMFRHGEIQKLRKHFDRCTGQQ